MFWGLMEKDNGQRSEKGTPQGRFRLIFGRISMLSLNVRRGSLLRKKRRKKKKEKKKQQAGFYNQPYTLPNKAQPS